MTDRVNFDEIYEFPSSVPYTLEPHSINIGKGSSGVSNDKKSINNQQQYYYRRISMKYDYLIVGSGLFGSIIAYEMTKIGKNAL